MRPGDFVWDEPPQEQRRINRSGHRRARRVDEVGDVADTLAKYDLIHVKVYFEGMMKFKNKDLKPGTYRLTIGMSTSQIIDAITKDPAWQGGEYKTPPVNGLRAAADFLVIAGSAPIQMQKELPTRDAADAFVEKTIDHYIETLDANDFLYQVSSSADYDPSPDLEKIKAPVLWINSADDLINPPSLPIAAELARRIPHGRYIVIPESDQTHGHGTHTWASVWQDRMAELLKETDR